MLAGEGCVGVTGGVPGDAARQPPTNGSRRCHTHIPQLESRILQDPAHAAQRLPHKLGMTYAGGSIAPATSRLIFGAATWLAFAGGFCANT